MMHLSTACIDGGFLVTDLIFQEDPSPSESPEKRLCYAILIEAWRSLHAHERKVREAARDWFLSDWEGSVFAFVNVCDTLQIDRRHARASIANVPCYKRIVR